jgi:hypothetical protein
MMPREGGAVNSIVPSLVEDYRADLLLGNRESDPVVPLRHPRRLQHVQVIRLLSGAGALHDVARRTKMPKSTAFRILATFDNLGVVAGDAEQKRTG